jgi:hypothetical protein
MIEFKEPFEHDETLQLAEILEQDLNSGDYHKETCQAVVKHLRRLYEENQNLHDAMGAMRDEAQTIIEILNLRHK